MLRVAVAAALLSYAPAVELCRFADPRIDESSGVSASSYTDDHFFTHNDSGDSPRIFAVDRTGATLDVFGVAGADAVDWEDMARGRSDDGPVLFLADIGDNFRRRQALVVYEVLEPELGRQSGAVVERRYELRYDDGPHDAEAFLVHPRDNRFYVVTKERQGPAGVYTDAGGVLTRVADVNLDELVHRRGAYARAITGGEIKPDGSAVVLRTPFEAFEWMVEGDVAAAFAGEPRRIPLAETEQGEAIAYSRDGESLLVTSEGVGAPVHLLAGTDAASPNYLTPVESYEPYEPEPEDDGGFRMSKPVAFGIAWLISVVYVRARRGRRRRRRRPPPSSPRPA